MTSAGSTEIVINATAHGTNTETLLLLQEHLLWVEITADVLNQNYEVDEVIDVNNYQISATATASASDTGDGGNSASERYETQSSRS